MFHRLYDWTLEYRDIILALDLLKIEELANHIESADLIVFCGNGGSYAIASHMAGDILINTPIKGNTITLGDNLTSFSAYSNDSSYEEAMALELLQRTESQVSKKVIVVLLSTSGSSKNIVRVAQEASSLGFFVASITGKRPEILAPYSDLSISLESSDAGFIEAGYDFIGHLLVRTLNERH